MKKTNFATMVKLAAVLAFPIAAFADINGTATLSAGGNFSLDNGTNVSSGGDISFTGTSLTFVGNAKGIILKGFTGTSLFQNNVNSIILGVFIVTPGAFTSTPIPVSSLTAGTAAGTIIGLETNGGNPAKILITALSSTSISFQYYTYESATSGGGPSAPTITTILNNSSLIPSGFSNSGIAPSTLFVIEGTNLANAGTASLWNVTSTPLPLTMNGASISVTVGGKTVQPAIYYTCSGALNSAAGCGTTAPAASMIAAVLPASTPVGTGTLTVTVNGTPSAPATIQVVPSALGIDTYNGGTGVITDAVSYALLTPTSSGKPGEFVTLWGTGLGADPADSDTAYTSTPHPVSANLQIYIGGVQATNIAFQGASVYPGVDVVIVQIPASVGSGCYVPVVGVVGNVISNTVTIPVMPNGGVCTEPLYGITGTQIGASTSTTLKSGSVLIGQLVEGSTGTFNLAEATFDSVTESGFSASGSSAGIVSIGACIVTEINSSSTTSGSTGTVSVTYLDAGTLSLQGPAGTYPLTELSKGSYESQLPASAIPQNGGTFVFTGNGGADVGPFTATVNLPNPILTWTNQSAAATITRAQGLQVTWVGGGPGTYVYISGSSAANGVVGGFSCYAPQSALQFTVPPYILSVLPPGQGSVLLENLPGYSTFSAPGINSGYAIGFTGVSVTSVYQ